MLIKAKSIIANLLLDQFKWQIKFLPLTQPEQDKAIEAQAKGLWVITDEKDKTIQKHS